MAISTFLFAIFTWFFIYQQSERYVNLRKYLATMDWEITNIFRASTHLWKECHKDIKEHLRSHYKKIVDSKKWNVYLAQKTNLISGIHNILEKLDKKNCSSVVASLAIEMIMNSTSTLQVNRKEQLSIDMERVPVFHWLVIYFLAITLLITFSVSFDTNSNILFSIIKALFASSIFLIIFLLKHLENMDFFETNLWEWTAKDFLDITDNKK